MSDSATSTLSDKAHVLGGDSQSIRFRPGKPGTIFAQSVPSRRTAHTENGLLAAVFLWRPGSTTAAARTEFQVGSPSFSLAYNATAQDLASAGDWVCEVANESLDPNDFSTDVTFPIANPIVTASMDVPFLNLVLAKIFDAAAIRIHLQGSSNGLPASSVLIAQDMAALLKVPTFTTFVVDDQKKTKLGIEFVYRIMNLDSDPAYPIVFLSTSPLAFKIVIRFDTSSAKLVAQNLPAPDINLEFLNVEIDIGFDGSFHPVCNASAHLAFNNIDFSDDVKSGVEGAVTGQLRSNSGFAGLLDSQQVRAQIDRLFIALMRLGPTAQIQSYAVDGQRLIVSYFLQ